MAGKFDRVLYPDSTGPALGPVWTEQHGSAAAVDSLRDSISYDGWERVIAVVTRKNGAVATRDTFQFTRTGNLRTTAGAETYDGTTDRLTSRAATGCGATWSYTYDRAGNLVTAVCGTTTWTYQYDALNQLRAVRYNATLIARYTYDVLGRRIAKRVYSSATGGTVAYTRFVSHGAHVAFETDSAGTITLRYTWGLGTDDLLAVRDAAGNHYYAVQDVLGSVRGLVKRDGTWQASWRYGPYGAVVDSAGSAPVALRYRWTGREYDAETGWFYFRARYYEPAVRRFVQEDPIGYGAGSNVYAYGAGGPLETRDPSGLRMTPDMYAVKELCRCGGGGSTWNLYPDWAFAAMAYGVQKQMAMESRYLEDKARELAQTGATTVNFNGRTIVFDSKDLQVAGEMAGVATETLVEVISAAISTDGLHEVTFSGGYDLKDHNGTRDLYGPGTGKVYTHGGMAVDIGRLNGFHVNEPAVRQVVADFQFNLAMQLYALEVYGPAWALSRPSPQANWAPAKYATWMFHAETAPHIHYSSYGVYAQ